MKILIFSMIVMAVVLLIPTTIFAQLDDNPKNIDPQPNVIEFAVDSKLEIKKIMTPGWIVGEMIIDEKNNRLFLQTVKSPHPGYGKGVGAIALTSADVNLDKYSNFKNIEFEHVIGFDLNSKLNIIYLFEFDKKNILIINSNSLEILDEITVDFESNYRQRDIVVNENTNKIYLLLEEMGKSGGTVHSLKYKILVFDGTTKNMINEIELNEPADQLLIDLTNNLTYADNWVAQKYFIIDNNEKLSEKKIPASSDQYIAGMIINEKNNQMHIRLTNVNGHIQEILVVDASSGGKIQEIKDSTVLSSSISIKSPKNDVVFFSIGTRDGQGIAIMNIDKGVNEIVKKISIPGTELGYLRAIDEELGKLYSSTNDGVVVFDIEKLLTTSSLGIDEITSDISEEYVSCWKNIQELDTNLAKDLHSKNKINHYWEQSKTMHADMINECEEIKTIAIAETNAQEQIMQEQRLDFPDSVDSRCDLVYLINREGENYGTFGLSPEESTINEIKSITQEYQQRISDEPWNAEEIGQELLDKIEKEMVDSIMKKYSIHNSLRSAVSQLITPVGTYDLDILRGILLMKPEHYVEDLECGKMLKTHYYDQMYKFNVAAYGADAADKMGFAIDKAIEDTDVFFNPISVIKDTVDKIESNIDSDIRCGAGTIEKNGQCVVDSSNKSPSNTSSKGGGCLIATATYGSELAPEVQKLRELRDNSLLTTTSGTQFMSTFNGFYYSFSPVIADYERENPVFKEMVKVAITPMVSSLSILNYVDMDSESSVLGYGISLIILNGMMYVGLPIAGIIVIRKRF